MIKDTESGKLSTKIIYDSKRAGTANVKKIASISSDLAPYIEALQSLRYEYKQIVNEGLSMYINQLSDKEKKRVRSVIDLHFTDDEGKPNK